MTRHDCDEPRMTWVMTYLLPVIATRQFSRDCKLLTTATLWPTVEGQSSRKHQMGSVKETFPQETTSIEIWWSRLVDGKEPVCPFAGTFVMIVRVLVTWAIYTQGQLLLWSRLIITGDVPGYKWPRWLRLQLSRSVNLSCVSCRFCVMYKGAIPVSESSAVGCP